MTLKLFSSTNFARGRGGRLVQAEMRRQIQEVIRRNGMENERLLLELFPICWAQTVADPGIDVKVKARYHGIYERPDANATRPSKVSPF